MKNKCFNEGKVRTIKKRKIKRIDAFGIFRRAPKFDDEDEGHKDF